MGSSKAKGFTDQERAAMKERAKELKAEAAKADGETAVLAKIAEMPEPERYMALRLHSIVKEAAPALAPKPSMACLRMPRTAGLSVFFSARRSLTPGTRLLVSPTQCTWMREPYGPLLSP